MSNEAQNLSKLLHFIERHTMLKLAQTAVS